MLIEFLGKEWSLRGTAKPNFFTGYTDSEDEMVCAYWQDNNWCFYYAHKASGYNSPVAASTNDLLEAVIEIEKYMMDRQKGLGVVLRSVGLR